jgi:SAM-dependent methyltransferase
MNETTARRAHWDGVYGAKRFTEVSWYQDIPARSLQQLRAAGADSKTPVIDVGGGASTFVDHLVERGFEDVTVLDISAAALEQARGRLGARGADVMWMVGDVTAFAADRQYGVWHDRAVLHFLTGAADRKRYVDALRRALAPGGHAIIATFGPEGPLKCSGLEVRRYSAELLGQLLGTEFELTDQALEDHQTPWGAAQQFLHTSWRRKG